MRIVRVVITDGRRQLCDDMLSSFDWYCDYDFTQTIVVNDSALDVYSEWLQDRLKGATIIHHPIRLGLAASIRSAWQWCPPCDHIVHLEDDCTFTTDIDIPTWARPLTVAPHLAQVCLQRGPQAPDEHVAGGILRRYARDYGTTHHDGWTEHTHLFSLQPNIYPHWVTQIGWPEHGGEREFTDLLIARDPTTRFAYLGDENTIPPYIHAGYGTRSTGWRL